MVSEGKFLYFNWMFEFIEAKIEEFIGKSLAGILHIVGHKVTLRPRLEYGGTGDVWWHEDCKWTNLEKKKPELKRKEKPRALRAICRIGLGASGLDFGCKGQGDTWSIATSHWHSDLSLNFPAGITIQLVDGVTLRNIIHRVPPSPPPTATEQSFSFLITYYYVGEHCFADLKRNA